MLNNNDHLKFLGAKWSIYRHAVERIESLALDFAGNISVYFISFLW